MNQKKRPHQEVMAIQKENFETCLSSRATRQPNYAFDPRRTTILLIGGDKTGDDRWYKKNTPKADELYQKHLASLEPIKSKKDGKKHRRNPGQDGSSKARKK